MAKPKHEKLSWAEIAENLNAVGPSIKNDKAWWAVNIETIDAVINSVLKLFLFSGLKETLLRLHNE